MPWNSIFWSTFWVFPELKKFKKPGTAFKAKGQFFQQVKIFFQVDIRETFFLWWNVWVTYFRMPHVSMNTIIHPLPLYDFPQLPNIYRGGFRGGGADASTSQGFDPLPTQRVPLWYFLRNPFSVTDPKIFLKAPFAPIYTNFEGERAPKKTRFFLWKFSKKCTKTAFLTCFLMNLPAAQTIWPKQRLYSALGKLRKSIWST